MALGDMSAVTRTCPVPRCASLQHLFHCLYLVLNDVIINCHWSLGIPWLVYWLVVIWINLIQWIFQGWLSYHPSRTDPVSTIHAAYSTSIVWMDKPWNQNQVMHCKVFSQHRSTNDTNDRVFIHMFWDKNRRRDDYWTVPTHWSSRSCAQHITRISLYESLLSINVYGHISSTYKYSGFKNSIQRWIWIFTYTIGSSHHRFHSQVDRCVLVRWFWNTFLMQFVSTEVNDTNDRNLTRFRIVLGFITSSNRHINTHWISTVPRSSHTGDWNYFSA